jgi:nitrogen regulatory protein PII
MTESKLYEIREALIECQKKSFTTISVNLGNSGEGFSESFEGYSYMEELVNDELVQVIEVDESFYNTFHAAKLDRLSLCNIFEEKDRYE